MPVAAAPEPGCAGRDSACEARCLGSRQPETVHQGLFSPGLSAPSQPTPWVPWNRTLGLGGGERGFYCSHPNLQQQANSPHALLPGGIFSNRSSKPAPHRPLSFPGTRSPLCLLNPLSRDRDWRTCSKRARHLLFPSLLLTMAFPCKVSRNTANENVGGKVLVLSLLLLSHVGKIIRKFQITRKSAEKWGPRREQPTQELAFLFSIEAQSLH